MGHRQPPGRAADAASVLAIAAVWIGMAALADPVGEFPLDDDWMYSHAAKTLVEQGDFRILGPTIPNSLTAVLWGALFCLPRGFSFLALRLSTLTIGLIGILALYALLRQIGATWKTALVGGLTAAVNPVYFGLANTFMTDIPFLGCFMTALFFLVRGLCRRSTAWLVTGVVMSLVAVLARQVGLFLLLAFAVSYPMRNGFRPSAVVKGLLPLAAGLIVHFGYQRWLTGTGRGPEIMFTGVFELLPAPASLGGLLWSSVERCVPLVTYVGFFIAPFLILCLPGRRGAAVGARTMALRGGFAALGVAFFAVLALTGHRLPSLHNVLVDTGLGPVLLRDNFLPHPNSPAIPAGMRVFWLAATALGVAAFWLLSARIVEAARGLVRAAASHAPDAGGWLHLLILGTAVSYWGAMLLLIQRDYGQMYDRYLLLFVPLAMALLVCTREPWSEPRWRRARLAASLALIAFYAGYSVATTHDYFAWNRARWASTQHLMVDLQVPPSRIDGGYEFNGWYLYRPGYRMMPDKSFWWVDDDEYLIASGPVTGYRELRRYTVDRWLPFLGSDVVVLHRS